MIEDFRLPDLGEGLPEAELLQWLVAEGDTVTLNQTIAEVETAKAVVELPSPHAGVVRTLHAGAGDVVTVGAVLISYELADAEDASEPPNLVGYGAAPRGSGTPRRRPRAGATVPLAASQDLSVLADAPHDVIRMTDPIDARQERPRSTPPVRRLAKELGVELLLVAPSGPTGLITRADVEEFAQRSRLLHGSDVAHASPSVVRDDAPTATVAPAAGVAPSADGERITRTPIRGVRKHTAEAMVRSAFSAPHVSVFLTVDVTATSEFIASLRADGGLAPHRIGVLAVAAKAVCLALPSHPGMNSAWDAGAGEIVQHHYVNLGIAAATDRGLVVPNIRDADRMTLVELADAIAVLAATARSGKTSPADMAGGTFSISNVGVFGVDAGTPILNPGEAGILALGAVRSQPWEHRGEIALRDVLTLSLSFDHRLVDGQQGAQFLRSVADVLREPARAMLLR